MQETNHFSKSSVKVEYRSMSSATIEFVWLQHLLRELGVILLGYTSLIADSTSAMQITANPVFMSRQNTEVDCDLIQ